MTDTSERMKDASAAANELYWGSERSVNQIAEQLDLSKGALYGMIEPLPEGLGCPVCGEEVVSANRTARDRGVLSCAECEWKGDEDETLYTQSACNRYSVPPPAGTAPSAKRQAECDPCAR